MNKGTVLIVDDNLSSLKLLMDTLMHAGLRVLPADSGELALASTETTRPDVILLDLQMPVMDGFEVIRRLKSKPHSRDIPVIFLSASTEADLRVKAFDLGAVDFVGKPFERNELLARVNAHIELFQLRCELRVQAEALRRANENLQELRRAETEQAQQSLLASDQSRNAAEEALQRERILMTAIVESSGDGIVARDLNGIITSWNSAAQRIFGYTAQEMLGRTADILIPEERRAQAAMIPEKIRQGTPICDLETERLCKDGTRITVSLTVSPIRDLDGRISGMSSIVRDITAQRQTERSLRESEARWKFALEGSGEGVWDWNIQTGEVQYSRHWKRMLGYASDEIDGNFQAWEKLVHPDDLATATATIQAYLGGVIPEFSTEFRMRSKDGTWKWMLSRGTIVSRSSDGKPLRMIGTHADITERKETELQVSFMAYHDRLTGLSNRSLLLDRLSQTISQARRNRKKVGILFADLDGFKLVNDLHGHDAGDIVLKAVAVRLVECVRAIDTVSRIGGDEFVIILGDLESASEATLVAAKLIEGVAPPIVLPGDRNCRVGLSIGISIYPEDGTEMDILLAAADAAMYQSKASGKGKHTVFDKSSQARTPLDDWVSLDGAHCVGVVQIDDQHRQLVIMVNQLNQAIRDGARDSQIKQLFHDLNEFIAHHFATEHALMERYQYPGQVAHDAIHSRLLAETFNFNSRLNKGGDLLLLQSLKDWLMAHIQTEDRVLGEFLQGKL